MHKYLLKDISQIYSGSTPSTSDKANYGGNIIWITPKDLSVQKCKYINKGEKNITQKGYQSCSTTILPIGTVLLSSRAPIGLLAIASSELCTNQGFKNIVPNSDLIDSDYLYYFLSTKIREIEALGSGTTFKEVSKTSLENYQIFIHDIYDQKKISNFLNLLDKKIELNNKINFELEQIAKEWYNYWFVQFDFPGENGRPYKSSGGKMVYNEVLKREIPDGWTNGTLSDISNTQTGYAFKSSEWKDSGHPVLTIKAIENNSINMSEASYIENYKEKYAKYSVNNGNIILAMTGNTIGKIGIIASDIKNILINQRLCIYKTNYNNIAYLYFNLLSGGIQKKIWQIAQNSSQPNVSEEQLKLLPIVLPPQELINKYNKKFSCYFKRIVNNNMENQHLSKLRNFLLPLLMNGQVIISSAH